MTDEEYRSQSDVLRRELERIRGLLDQHAAAPVKIEGDVFKKVHGDLGDVIRRYEELDRSRWPECLKGPQG